MGDKKEVILLSNEENKALACRLFDEVWAKGNLAVADEVQASNFVLLHAPPGIRPDREGYKQWAGMISIGFTDRQNTIEEQIAEGDKDATRWTMKGKHTGDLMGVAATNKQATVTGITIDRFEGGKIVEEWNEVDQMGMMQQLGVIKPPEQK